MLVVKLGLGWRAGDAVERRDSRHGVSGTLAGTNQALDFPQRRFDMAFKFEGIERSMFLLQSDGPGGFERAAFQEALVRSFRSIMPLDLARPFRSRWSPFRSWRFQFNLPQLNRTILRQRQWSAR